MAVTPAVNPPARPLPAPQIDMIQPSRGHCVYDMPAHARTHARTQMSPGDGAELDIRQLGGLRVCAGLRRHR